MEMFDAHRRDILNFDNYMDLKKPGFGGPKSAVALRDNRGNIIDKTPKLDGYRRTVERDPAFNHPVYDPTYKAMTHDLVYKQEKKKPFNYDTRTGIPVVEIEPLKEGKTYTSFTKFINEADDYLPGEEDDQYVPEYPEDTEEDSSSFEAMARSLNNKLSNFDNEGYDSGANPSLEDIVGEPPAEIKALLRKEQDKIEKESQY